MLTPPQPLARACDAPRVDADASPRLLALVADHLDTTPERLTPDLLLAEDLGLDSLAAIELGMALEDEFEIALPDAVVVDVRTVAELVRIVLERLPAGSG